VIAENYWGEWAVSRRLEEMLRMKKELKGKI
jgi:hypothetical protein